MSYKNMYVISSTWGDVGSEKPTFKMIPLSEDCPYQECIYEPSKRILAVISKTRKQNYIMTHKVDENGDPVFLKHGTRPNGKNYKEERRLVETFTEYYIESPIEIKEFIEMFAINPDVAKRTLDAPMAAPSASPMTIVGDVPVEITAESTDNVNQ